MLKKLVTATALLIGVGMATPLTAKTAWNYAGHITAVSPTALTVFDNQYGEYHTLAYDNQTAINHWIRERPFVRRTEALTPDALLFGGLVRVRLRDGEGAEPVAAAIEVASDVKTAFSGRVQAFDETSLSVSNDDMNVVTLKYSADTAFRQLFTEKPWVRGPVRLSPDDLKVGAYVIMHSTEPGALTTDRVEIARSSASAQNTKADVTIGKNGEVHFNVPVKAGGTLLQPGMYQLQHAVEGGQHYVTFKEMQMPAGYRHSNTPVDKTAAARIACKVEPLEKKAGKTAVTLRANAAGEKEVADVQIAGEAFKHVL